MTLCGLAIVFVILVLGGLAWLGVAMIRIMVSLAAMEYDPDLGDVEWVRCSIHGY